MTVVSHEYKFIFVKTGKTAGTAIEVELSKIGGPDDVFTKLFPLWRGTNPATLRDLARLCRQSKSETKSGKSSFLITSNSQLNEVPSINASVSMG